MSRSLGDKVAQSVGVSPIPEIFEFHIKPTDSFIVIASDGIWEFLSNEDVAKLVANELWKGTPETAANALVKESFFKWREEEDVIDDITCIIIVF